ncbi:hypothetical protein IR123_00885 [Streptococcus sp. 19428wC2_LYSM12]|uniref:hypothetical protein n=1 Tax=Streptococcus sp. LYSM12 TaxID=2558276 RepID=UPI0010FFF12B|nr:hypothetical protein [Streptococcus sp. LYSM12]MBF0786482.1 hypothetical protein [Streptococcus sp. 19428wC2_LYSM12]TFV06646.1 hypothetical protein E4T79_00850 [Streptococcus sp. LYSM12]
MKNRLVTAHKTSNSILVNVHHNIFVVEFGHVFISASNEWFKMSYFGVNRIEEKTVYWTVFYHAKGKKLKFPNRY